MAGISSQQGRLYAFLGVAVIHLGFVTAGACELDFHRAGWAVAQVAALSGSDSAYGFFAPGVGSQLRATFQVVDADGATSDELLPTSASHEAKLRIADLIALFWTADEGLRRALAASWAGRILAKHPERRGRDGAHRRLRSALHGGVQRWKAARMGTLLRRDVRPQSEPRARAGARRRGRA